MSWEPAVVALCDNRDCTKGPNSGPARIECGEHGSEPESWWAVHRPHHQAALIYCSHECVDEGIGSMPREKVIPTVVTVG